MNKPNPPKMKASRNKSFCLDMLLILGLAFIAFAVYSNSLQAPFYLDDSQFINNPAIQINNLSLKNLYNAELESYETRPLPVISLTINYYFNKKNVLGYHIFNISVHILTGLFLFLFFKVTLEFLPEKKLTEATRIVPFFAALIWLVHPIQIQSVTYIIQRMNSMAALFYILSMLLYVHARLSKILWKKYMLFTCCLITALLALGSKENAAMLPLFILLYEWFFIQDLNVFWFKRKIPLILGVTVFLVIMGLIYMGNNPTDQILSKFSARGFTPYQRVLTEFRVVIFYISLLIFPKPSRLNLEHDFSLSYSFIEPTTTILSLSILIVLVGISIWLAKRERLLSFAILWYLGNLVIESSVLPLEIIFEHRNYLPSMLLCLLGTTAVIRFIRGKRQYIILLCVIVVLFSFWTFKRNSIWSDKILFYEDALNKSPSNVRVNMDLAEALIGKGRFDEGVQYYRMAIVLSEEKRNSGEVLQPYHYDSIFHLATRLAEKKRYSEASILFERVVQLYPHDANYHNNYAFVLEKLGYLDKAIYHYSQALRYNPNFNSAKQGLEWTKKRKAAQKN